MKQNTATHLQVGLIILLVAAYLVLTLAAPFKANAEPVCGILRPMRPHVVQPMPFNQRLTTPLVHGHNDVA